MSRSVRTGFRSLLRAGAMFLGVSLAGCSHSYQAEDSGKLRAVATVDSDDSSSASYHRIQGMKFRGGREKMDFYRSGRVAFGFLAEETVIDGLRYGPWMISFFESGAVKEGYLADMAEIRRAWYYGPIFFFAGGLVRQGMLAKNTTIDGVEFKYGTGIRFYEDGAVLSGSLAKDTDIKGIRFKEGSFLVETLFYNNGSVKKGILAKDALIQGKAFKAGETVGFDDSGQLDRKHH